MAKKSKLSKIGQALDDQEEEMLARVTEERLRKLMDKIKSQLRLNPPTVNVFNFAECLEILASKYLRQVPSFDVEDSTDVKIVALKQENIDGRRKKEVHK